jgi:hypothetical protein
MPFQVGGVTRMTNQNPRLPSHIPSQFHLTWHSGNKVVASGWIRSCIILFCAHTVQNFVSS